MHYFAHKTLVTLAVAAATVALSDDNAQSQDGSTGTSFLETFDGPTLDEGRWYVSNGWSNGEHQSCTWSDRNVKLEGGTLSLALTTTRSKDREYSCAEIQTKRRYKYGLYEVRMQAVKAPGTVSAFFSYIGPTHGKPHDEIDVEFLGKNPNAVQLNFYVAGKGTNEKIVNLGFDGSAGMHDYAFEWASDRLRWFIDGRLVHEVKSDRALPSNPSKIFLSLWNGDLVSWLGRFEMPKEHLVMRIEQVAFTAPGEACQFAKSVACDPISARPELR